MQRKRLVSAVTAVVLLGIALFLSKTESAPPRADGPQAPIALKYDAAGAIHARISPDGQSIAFSLQGTICRVDPDFQQYHGEFRRLTRGEGFDIEPVWSPDGRRIAYVNSPNSVAGPLRVIDAEDGSDIPLPMPVVAIGRVAYNKLEFHPDGERILGVFRRAGRDLGLAWYNYKTGEVTSVTTLSRWARYALSADGTRIVFTATMDTDGQQTGNNGPHAELKMISANGGEAQTIGRFPARIYDLCWQGNTDLFVVSDLGSVHNNLWFVRLKDDSDGRTIADIDFAQQWTSGLGDEDRPSTTRPPAPGQSQSGRRSSRLIYTDNNNPRGTTSIVVRELLGRREQTLTLSDGDQAKRGGTLNLDTAAETGSVSTRVSIRREGGRYYGPVGEIHRVLGDTGHFYWKGKGSLWLPAGQYRLAAWRGPEYRPVREEFTIADGAGIDLRVDMTRWHNAAAGGWYSGENHIHANYGYGNWYNNPQTMLEQCEGEDLNVCNFMVANSDGDAVFDREYFRGRPDSRSTDRTLLYWNQEFRSTIWGHMTLVNLKQVVEPVFTGFKDTTNPWDIPTNSDIADRTHWQNGLVNYTHVAQNPDDPYKNPYTGKAIPVDVALGKIDSLDLNATYNGTVVPLWHRLLNCGFRLPASAGTDCFLNRIYSRLPGGHRVYVKVDGRLSYEKWIDGLRAGRSFVTNGPMLTLDIEGRSPGDTIRSAGPLSVRIVAETRSQFPLDQIDVFYNGKIVASNTADGNRLSIAIDQSVELDNSGWIAVRATGPDHPDCPTGTLYAHTSPIYVEIDNQPAGSTEDARYFLEWIDRLELAVRVRDRIPNDELRDHVRSQFEAARRVYAEIATRGG